MMKNLKEEIKKVVDIYKSGNLLKAEPICEKLISENPKTPFLYNLSGLIFAGQRKFDSAIKRYEAGLRIDPKFGMIYNNLGLLFLERKSYGYKNKAEEYYKKSISADKNIPEPHNNLGSLYNTLHRYDDAVNCFKKSISVNPKFSPAHYNLGVSYISLGLYRDAEMHLRESIKLSPNLSSAHRSLSRIIKYTDKEEHFYELKKLYESSNDQSRIDLGFALGKAFEDIKNFDDSFIYYKKANFLNRKKINFSLEDEKEKFKEIKNIFNKNIFNKFMKAGYGNKSPIFILGMPRSGTTLIEQIISNHPKVYGAGEAQFIPNIIKKNFGEHNLSLFFDDVVNFDKTNLRNMGDEYMNEMNKVSFNAERTTDKLPINFLWIGLIKLILPESRIIHCYRNSKDNIFSIFKNHFPGGKVTFAYNLKETVEYYNLYFDLMNYWNSILPNFILNLKYESLVTNLDTEVKKLLKFCNLDWSDECLNFHENKKVIKTASDTQVRKKIFKTSIDYWKNYEKYLNEDFSKLQN